MRLACTLLDRTLGLLKASTCADGDVLAILPCRSVHSFGMKESIDVAFIDKDGRVVSSMIALPKNRVASSAKAICVLERRSACANGRPWFKEGDLVDLSLVDPKQENNRRWAL